MAMVQMQAVHSFTDSTALLDRPQALRERAAQDGYLFFKGLIPRAEVLGMRAMVLNHCHALGWLDPTAPRNEGRLAPGLEPIIEGQPAWYPFYRLLYTRRELHAFNQHPAVMAACRTLFNDAVLAHPRLIVRAIFPRATRFTTPPHQDYFYIGGTPNTWTSWIPLGDCPSQLGGLAIAPGSHRQGLLKTQAAEGAGGNRVEVDADRPWVRGDYEAGDVIIFHSYTVHQGRDNLTDRLRLSCDFRYQPLSEAVREDSLEPHMRADTDPWEQIYAGWDPQDPLRHYWQRLPLKLARWGES